MSALRSGSFASTLFYQLSETGCFVFQKLANTPAVILTYVL